MQKITSFNKENLRDLRIELNLAFAEIEKKTGVKIAIGNIGFRSDTFTFKGSAVLASTVSDPYLQGVDPSMIDNLKRFTYGPKALLKRITIGGRKVVIVGQKGRNRLLYKVEGSPSQTYWISLDPFNDPQKILEQLSA